jgi:hypothetical protein
MKKNLKILTVAIASLLLVMTSALYYISKKHHRSAHQELVAYLNKEFEGQVSFRDFSLSYLRSFPRIHAELLDVSVMEGKKEIIKIGDLDVKLSFGSIFKRKLKVGRVILTDVTFIAVTDSMGHAPKLLQAKSSPADSVHKALIIDARKIEIRNGLIGFVNHVKKNRTWIRVHHADLKLRSSDSLITISGFLDGHLDSLISNNSVLFADLPAAARDVVIEIERKTGVKELKSGFLQSRSLVLNTKLRMEPHQDGQLIDFHIGGTDSFDAFIALFQFHFGIDLVQSNPDARLNLSYNQSGFVNPFRRPYSELDFEISDAVFTGEALPFPLEMIIAKGNYNNGQGHSPETVELVIDTLYAEVSDSFVGGHLKLTNLKDPVIDAFLSSSIDLRHLFKPGRNFSLTGLVDLKLNIAGRLSELKKLHMEGKQQATGEIRVRDLELVLQEGEYSLKLQSGATTLNNHILEISSIIGAFNNSAFHFNGHLENLDQYLLNQNEKLVGKLALNFESLDISQLQFKGNEHPGQSDDNAFPFSLVAVELIVNGRRVVTPLGDLENISAKLLLADDLLEVSHLRFDYQQGHVESSGEIAFDDEGGLSAVNAKLDGRFRNLDIELPLQHQGDPSQKGSRFIIPSFIHADVSLSADKIRIKDVPLEHLSLKAKLKGQEITLAELKVNAFEGRTFTNGKITLDSSGVNGLWINSSVEFDHLQPELIMKQLGIQDNPGSQENTSFSLPGQMDIRIDFAAMKITFRDLDLRNTGFTAHGTDKRIDIDNFQSDLPFGHLQAAASVSDFMKGPISISGDVSLKIESLDLEGLLTMDALHATLAGSRSERPGGESIDKRNKQALPPNIDVSLSVAAEEILYKKIRVDEFSLGLDYDDERIDLKGLDLSFAGGRIHLEGLLDRPPGKSLPGHAYVKTDNLDIKEILGTFDNFGQDDFTAENTSGRISSVSHHYFSVSNDLEFILNDNLWLANVNLHHAEFDQVRPIENTLSFVGHKSRDTMIVNELNMNLVLAGKELFFTDLVMNDNIANMELSGKLDLVEKELDLIAEISLSDLLFRSKNSRMMETREGISHLDEDSKLFLELFGPLSDHELKLISRKKFQRHREDLVEEISTAEREFRDRESRKVTRK